MDLFGVFLAKKHEGSPPLLEELEKYRAVRIYGTASLSKFQSVKD
jgi:hypothetical protein